jgi:transcriptional regulator with XRE-family HTH domain
MNSLGARIRARRVELGWIQEQLAVKVGMSIGFLSDLENGKRNISAANLKRIAQVLDLSLDFLMKGDDTPAPQKEIQIPASLSEFARLEELSYRQTLTLLEMRRQIMANRRVTPKYETDDFDWRKLYESVKGFLNE